MFGPTTLERALERFGFVQADPIRAPARAQDLTLRHRVKNYRAGDLERRYATLGVEEDYFLNYGFVTKDVYALMHPRDIASRWPPGRRKKALLLLEFVSQRGAVHPREVDDHFSHGTVTNYWGGSSSATTQLLQVMQYGGLLRVERREQGIRIYAPHRRFDGAADGTLAVVLSDHSQRLIDAATRQARIDALVDVTVRKYAPLPGASLSYLVRCLRYAAPQWQADLTAALQRARQRLAHTEVEGVEWYWPARERPERSANDSNEDTVRLLAPFDPLVWDRRRFELFWNWAYRFEAYTPLPKRKLGYYALPLLWRDRIVGWGNLSLKDGALLAQFGYVAGRPPRDRVFSRALDAEIDRMRTFLGASVKGAESTSRRPR